MPDIQTTPTASSYVDLGGTANWSGNDVALTDYTGPTIGPWQSDSRRHAVGTAFDTLHDGCAITNIEVRLTASQNTGLNGNSHASASYAGVVAQDSTYVTTTPTQYTANGGSTVLPSQIRSGGTYSEISVSARNNDAFYPTTVTVTGVTLIVSYIDNGLPGLIQFSF